MNVTVGSAPCNWGVWFASDHQQTPWRRFMDEIVEAGYLWTELGPYGYLPTDLELLRTELKQRDLKVTGTFAMDRLANPQCWDSIERQFTGAGELLQALDAEFLILIDGTYTDERTGTAKGPARLNDADWKRLIDAAHRTARTVRDRYGLRTAFHPHAETNVEYEDQTERFLEDTDPGLICICLDTGHHAYRGGDPVSFMRKHHTRIAYLHLKSVDAEIQDQVQREDISFGQAVAMDMFCEPARGMVDFLAFRDVLAEVDFNGYAIVEQDMYPAPFDKPLPIARRTREYFRQIGIG